MIEMIVLQFKKKYFDFSLIIVDNTFTVDNKSVMVRKVEEPHFGTRL